MVKIDESTKIEFKNEGFFLVEYLIKLFTTPFVKYWL